MGSTRIAALLVILQVFVLVECRIRDEVVRMSLAHFNATRNNRINPDVKTAARDYILQTFKDHGLDTWTEELPSNQIEYPGVNVIGRVSGKYTGTSQDKVVIIATHYDSVQTTNGVDDNGSGMTALLHALKLYTSPDKLNCKQDYTTLFVAFDLEEYQPCQNQSAGYCSCAGALCGSDSFVKNLSRYLNETGGELQGAYIMDTVMNYNTTPHSQHMPHKAIMKTLQLADEYDRIANDSFRGNFLALIGRKDDDGSLFTQFVKHYPKNDEFRSEALKLPFSGRPADQPGLIQTYIAHFLRSDHKRFWNHKKSWPAVFITDTADFRGHMKSCYHEMCDDMDHVTPEMITSMGKTAEALAGAAESMSKQVCQSKQRACDSKGVTSNGKTTITSQYHPSKYPNGVDCTWLKESESNQIITFDEWELETSVNCTKDYLEIRDGRGANDRLIGRYCGKTKPQGLVVKPTDKIVSIRFHSDAFDTYKGFKITWSGAQAILACRLSIITLAAFAVLSIMVSTQQ